MVGCDRKLDKIWAKATATDPAERYDTAEEMAKDLEGWAVPDPPTQTLRTMQRPPRMMGARPAAAVPQRRAAPVTVVHHKKKSDTDWSLLFHILIVGAVIAALFYGWKAYQAADSGQKETPAGETGTAPAKETAPPAPEPGKKPEAPPEPSPPPLPPTLDPPPSR